MYPNDELERTTAIVRDFGFIVTTAIGFLGLISNQNLLWNGISNAIFMQKML